MAAPKKETIQAEPDYSVKKGDLVHLVTVAGAKYKSAEVLSVSPSGLTVRSSLLGPTQSEVTLVPWASIDGVGLIGKR